MRSEVTYIEGCTQLVLKTTSIWCFHTFNFCKHVKTLVKYEHTPKPERECVQEMCMCGENWRTVCVGGTFAEGAACAEGTASRGAVDTVWEDSEVAVKPQPKLSVPATIL